VALTVTNTGKTIIATWAFEFDYPSTSATSGTAPWSTRKDSYTGSLPGVECPARAGQTISLGFIANPGKPADPCRI